MTKERWSWRERDHFAGRLEAKEGRERERERCYIVSDTSKYWKVGSDVSKVEETQRRTQEEVAEAGASNTSLKEGRTWPSL